MVMREAPPLGVRPQMPGGLNRLYRFPGHSRPVEDRLNARGMPHAVYNTMISRFDVRLLTFDCCS